MSATQLMNSQRPRVLKLAVVGAGGVGKSTLIGQLTTGEFIETHVTVGFDVRAISIAIDKNIKVTVTMFDFGGQKQFRFIQGSLIQGSQIVLLVFDCSRMESLQDLTEWLALIQKVPSDSRLLVGTKIDIGITISEKIIKQFAEELGIDYVLVSSKTRKNIDILFEKIQSLLSNI